MAEKKTGIIEEMKGRAKQAFGALTGQEEAEKEGRAQREKGEAQSEATEKEVEAMEHRREAREEHRRQRAQE